MKRTIVFNIIFISLFLISFSVLANTQIEIGINSNMNQLKGGQEAIITVNLENYVGIKEGINCYKATLEYDKEIFKEITQNNFQSKNDWEELKYNKETGEFIAIKKSGSKEAEEILQIKLEVKEEAKATKTQVKIKDIVTSEGKEDIQINEKMLAIDIIEEQEEKPEDPKKPEKITSEKYKIEEGYISRIIPKTTVHDFEQNVRLENVITDPKMVFTDEEGNKLAENSKIKTGTKLKVGTTLQFTLIVIGDTDKDSEITINDMANIKLHLIETQKLTGIALKAADVDNIDNDVTINDLAQIKLILIDLLELK